MTSSRAPVSSAAPSATARTFSVTTARYSRSFCAKHEVRRREVGNDVRRLAPVGDDAVDAHVVAQMLAERVDAREKAQYRVQRVDALVRIHRGVCGLAVVRVAEADERESPLFPRLGVDEREVRSGGRAQRDVDTLEDTRLEQAALSAATLPGRRADALDRAFN